MSGGARVDPPAGPPAAPASGGSGPPTPSPDAGAVERLRGLLQGQPGPAPEQGKSLPSPFDPWGGQPAQPAATPGGPPASGLADTALEGVVPEPGDGADAAFAPPVQARDGERGEGGGQGEDSQQDDAERQAAFRGDEILNRMLGGPAAPSAPAEAQAPAAAQAARELIEAVADRLLVGRDAFGNEAVRIQLRPDSFGGAEVVISRHAGEIRVEVIATDPEAQLQLRRALPCPARPRRGALRPARRKGGDDALRRRRRG